MKQISTEPPSRTAALLRTLKESGLSQAEISRKTGIPPPRLSRWVNDINVPPGADDALKLQALVHELGTPAQVAEVAAPTQS